jgi:hypothetical protein
MADRNSWARAAHDLGLATWFGGSLMGAVGLNPAAKQASSANERLDVANAGWARWTPVNAIGIAAYTVGGAVLTWANKGQRLMDQEKVPAKDGTTPVEDTPPDVRKIQHQLKVLQYAIPAHVGALIAISAVMGEQQRTTQVARGVVRRLLRTAS